MKKLMVIFLFVFLFSSIIMPVNVYGVVEYDEEGNEIIQQTGEDEARITLFEGDEQSIDDEQLPEDEVRITTEEEAEESINTTWIILAVLVVGGVGLVLYKKKSE